MIFFSPKTNHTNKSNTIKLLLVLQTINKPKTLDIRPKNTIFKHF